MILQQPRQCVLGWCHAFHPVTIHHRVWMKIQIHWQFRIKTIPHCHLNLPFQLQSEDHKTVDFLTFFQNLHAVCILDILKTKKEYHINYNSFTYLPEHEYYWAYWRFNQYYCVFKIKYITYNEIHYTFQNFLLVYSIHYVFFYMFTSCNFLFQNVTN